jgi:hypothetical protein
MIRFVSGKPVHVPDDDRITPQMRDARTLINSMLARFAARGPDILALEKAYREGKLSETAGFQWYCDPDIEDKK